MNTQNNGDLDALIQEKLEADADFQASLDSMSDEDKEAATADKKSELVKAIFEEERQARIKAEEVGNNQKSRAEKAEQELKKNKPADGGNTPPPASDLSQKDVLVLAKANIHEDDIEEVIEFAKFKKIPVSEALKNQTLKTILAEKEEHRKTANATNTGSQRRVVNKVTDEKLVSDLSEGKVPEKGSEDAERLFWAKRGGKRQ